MSRDKIRISDIDINNIGDRIKYLRKYNKETQLQFANKINISRSNLSEIENGRYEPSYKVLKNIVENYDIDGRWLLTGEGEMTSGADGPGFDKNQTYKTEDDALEAAVSDLRANYSDDRDQLILAIIDLIKLLLKNQ